MPAILPSRAPLGGNKALQPAVLLRFASAIPRLSLGAEEQRHPAFVTQGAVVSLPLLQRIEASPEVDMKR